MTLDARKIDFEFAFPIDAVRAFDDLSYQFNQKFAGLGRIGYENLDYPLQPSASFNGPSWYIGGRYTPFGSSYLLLTFGRQEGLLGFNGALQYEITPRTVAFASFQKNRVSQQQQIFNNLNASGVDAYGNVVNQSTGLPISLVNTAFGNSNAVSEYETAQAGLQTRFERDSLSLYGFVAKRSPLVAPVFVSAGLAASRHERRGQSDLGPISDAALKQLRRAWLHQANQRESEYVDGQFELAVYTCREIERNL